MSLVALFWLLIGLPAGAPIAFVASALFGVSLFLTA